MHFAACGEVLPAGSLLNSQCHLNGPAVPVCTESVVAVAKLHAQALLQRCMSCACDVLQACGMWFLTAIALPALAQRVLASSSIGQAPWHRQCGANVLQTALALHVVAGQWKSDYTKRLVMLFGPAMAAVTGNKTLIRGCSSSSSGGGW